ncbi:hypothetical protein NIES4106_28070 [Fischerella sp. NIES-4106]|nr:hypothetical protein NIES4106_28070 [Fischerella sp. NIES-4106]
MGQIKYKTSPSIPLLTKAAVYTQIKIFHVETVSRLELKFQAHSESPLKWTGTNFFLSPLKRTCASVSPRNLFRGDTDALDLRVSNLIYEFET